MISERKVLRKFHEEISLHLDAIRCLFRDPDNVRISLVLRPFDDPTACDFITNDESSKVIETIQFLENNKKVKIIDTRRPKVKT